MEKQERENTVIMNSDILYDKEAKVLTAEELYEILNTTKAMEGVMALNRYYNAPTFANVIMGRVKNKNAERLLKRNKQIIDYQNKQKKRGLI